MWNLWAVARHTFVQCLRTRVAVAFAVLLAASLAALPAVMEGDGTLAGRIRAFLDYSTSAISVLLSITVVLLSVGVVSDDVKRKTVFLTCTKPLARWQYVVGRWLGVVGLSAALLGGSAAAVYGLAEYLRGRTELAIRPEDRRAVETEVFTARTSVEAGPPDVDRLLPGTIEQRKNNGTWQPTLEAYKGRYGLSQAEAVQRLVEDLRKQLLTEAQSVAPGRWLTWDFSGIRVRGEARQGAGRVTEVLPKAGVVAIETGPELVSRLVYFGPVWVNGVGGQVVGMWKGGLRAAFNLEDMKDAKLSRLGPGDPVQVRAEPTLQVSYKVSASDKQAVGPLRAAWKAENPSTHYVYSLPPRETPWHQQATLIVPARAVDEKGDLRVQFFNYAPVSVTVLGGDVAVLYGVGGFEGNFAKTAALMLMGLMFLAALGVFAGSALSFPVGCLLAMTMLLIGSTFRFLTEAVAMGIEFPAEGDPVFLYRISSVMLSAVKVLLPDLASTLATDYLVAGLRISWRYLGETALLTLAVRATALLGLACWVFHRRELARVQV